MSVQDKPVKNSTNVICHLCKASKDPQRDSETDGWKFDFNNHNYVCPKCYDNYILYWPLPRWEGEEIKFSNNSVRFTPRAFRYLVGNKSGSERDKILIGFLRDNSIEPIYGENRVVIHPGREIYVYYH